MNKILTEEVKKELRYTERINTTCSYCYHSIVDVKGTEEILDCFVVSPLGKFRVSDTGSCSKFKLEK